MKEKFKIAYLHMGADKTGSTALQSFMNNNRDVNKSAYGISYAPDVWHARLASYFSGSSKNFIHNVHSNMKDERQIATLDLAYMSTLEHWLTNITNPRKLIFSYEGFHCLKSDDILRMKTYLLKYAEEIKVIYYVRPPISYAISSMSQHIKMGLKIDDKFPISPYKQLISNLQKVFDKNEISVKKFTVSELYRNDLVIDFLHSIDHGYDFKKYLKNKKIENESLSDLACFVGNDVIGKYFTSDISKKISPYDLGWKMLPYLMNIQGGKLKLTPKQLDYVLINTQKNTDYIKSEFGINLNEDSEKFLYSEEEMSVINADAYQDKIASMASHILSEILPPSDNISEKPRPNVDTVNFEDIKGGRDIDFLRDEAIRIENVDLEKALRLMELAHRARPSGPFIKDKVMEYRARLVSSSLTLKLKKFSICNFIVKKFRDKL
jgi:hypothetical protein